MVHCEGSNRLLYRESSRCAGFWEVERSSAPPTGEDGAALMTPRWRRMKLEYDFMRRIVKFFSVWKLLKRLAAMMRPPEAAQPHHVVRWFVGSSRVILDGPLSMIDGTWVPDEVLIEEPPSVGTQIMGAGFRANFGLGGPSRGRGGGNDGRGRGRGRGGEPPRSRPAPGPRDDWRRRGRGRGGLQGSPFLDFVIGGGVQGGPEASAEINTNVADDAFPPFRAATLTSVGFTRRGASASDGGGILGGAAAAGPDLGMDEEEEDEGAPELVEDEGNDDLFRRAARYYADDFYDNGEELPEYEAEEEEDFEVEAEPEEYGVEEKTEAGANQEPDAPVPTPGPEGVLPAPDPEEDDDVLVTDVVLPGDEAAVCALEVDEEEEALAGVAGEDGDNNDEDADNTGENSEAGDSDSSSASSSSSDSGGEDGDGSTEGEEDEDPSSNQPEFPDPYGKGYLLSANGSYHFITEIERREKKKGEDGSAAAASSSDKTLGMTFYKVRCGDKTLKATGLLPAGWFFLLKASLPSTTKPSTACGNCERCSK
jgi:hypothetical protein